jgi:hypothetical protein
MRIDPTPFMQTGALPNTQSRSRLEAIEARKAFASLLSSASQRPVVAEERPPVSVSAQREQEVTETRMTSMAESEKEEETTTSPDPMQRPGRVLDIRV